MADIINIFCIALFFVCWFFIIKRYVPFKKATVTIKAKVYDKYKANTISRYPGTNAANYVVVFETDKGKLSFLVSEYSYNHYTKNERGTLKYKGNKLISFD